MNLESQTKIVSNINRYFLRVAGVLIVLFVVAQFIVLATLGTKGAEIARIRMQKDNLRLQNEYMRSEIDKAKTLGQIETGLRDTFNLQDSGIRVIYNTNSGTSLGSADVNSGR